MVIVVHDNVFITKVLDNQFKILKTEMTHSTLVLGIKKISLQFPEDLLIWCHQDYFDYLNIDELTNIFHHQRILASFNPSSTDYFPKALGYVDRTSHLLVNKNVQFPTWMMSSCVGGIYTKLLNEININLKYNNHTNFNYYLNSIAKIGMAQGVFCYSAPQLFKEIPDKGNTIEQASTYALFKFIKVHYKWVWVFFLTLCYWVFERRIRLLPLMFSFFYNQRKVDLKLDGIPIKSTRNVVEDTSIDVIIPTIGRKEHLYNVLKDLSKQSHLPKNVIIVEQTSDFNAHSELNYLISEDWPFNIKHTFTHQVGVCNARNLALSKVESAWTLLGDDDNRFEKDLIDKLFKAVETVGTQVGTTVYLQPQEKQIHFKTMQSNIFGAGNSIMKSNLINMVKFDMKYEFNYGEDNDFGMQIRHLGEDIIYFANINISHLKAPIGGYRTKTKQLWDDDVIPPKPSPTIYLLHSSYSTKQQLLGYKLELFLKYYKSQSIKNPIAYYKNFKKRWRRSAYWAKQLEQNTNT